MVGVKMRRIRPDLYAYLANALLRLHEANWGGYDGDPHPGARVANPPTNPRRFVKLCRRS